VQRWRATPRSWIDACPTGSSRVCPCATAFGPRRLPCSIASAAGDHLVLLSASPDLYVPRIGKLLGFDETLCTEIAWRTGTDPTASGGTLQTQPPGEEKSRCVAWLRTGIRYAVIAYGNSRSDLPHLGPIGSCHAGQRSPAARRAAAASDCGRGLT